VDIRLENTFPAGCGGCDTILITRCSSATRCRFASGLLPSICTQHRPEKPESAVADPAGSGPLEPTGFGEKSTIEPNQSTRHEITGYLSESLGRWHGR
jgi:hypothetical protein